MTLTPQQQAMVDTAKKKYLADLPHDDRLAPPLKYDVYEMLRALDSLARDLCPPLDADVAAEIEALKAEYDAHGLAEVTAQYDRFNIKEAIDRTAAIFQRQSAQPGSVERVGELAEYAAKAWLDIDAIHQLCCVEKISPREVNAIHNIVWPNGAEYPPPPATSDKEARVKEANFNVGKWLSAALDDQNVCPEMKADIEAWMEVAPLPTVPTEGE